MQRQRAFFLCIAVLSELLPFASAFTSPVPFASCSFPKTTRTLGLKPCSAAKERLGILALRANIASSDAVTKFGTPSASEASRTLVSLIAEGDARGEIDRDHADYLINLLIQSGSRFSGDLLSSGPHRVAYTKNSTPFWEVLGSLIPIKKNDSFQDYDLSAGRLTSKAQIVGDSVCVVADAEVKEADQAVKTMPKDFNVLVTGVRIRLGDVELPLPVSGVGLARMLYQDQRLRIFVSPNSDSGWEEKGLIAVQVPAVQ